MLPFDSLLLGLLLAGTLTLLVGLIDDFGVLTPLAKVAGQGVAIFVLLRSGRGDRARRGARRRCAGRSPPCGCSAVCNAFNLLDIMDGLAAGVGDHGGARSGRRGAGQRGAPGGRRARSPWPAALLGFLVFNFHPARIYLGDAGSLAIGISLGALALAMRWTDRSPAGFLAPLVILVVPLADTVYVSVLRARPGQPFWHGSPDHFPLRLRRALGGAVRPAVLICYALALAGGLIGVGSVACGGRGSWQPVAAGRVRARDAGAARLAGAHRHGAGRHERASSSSAPA